MGSSDAWFILLIALADLVVLLALRRRRSRKEAGHRISTGLRTAYRNGRLAKMQIDSTVWC